MVSESRVTWPTSAPILVFLSISVLDLGLMCARDRQTSSDVIRQTSDAHHRLMPPTLRAGHNNFFENRLSNTALLSHYSLQHPSKHVTVDTAYHIEIVPSKPFLLPLMCCPQPSSIPELSASSYLDSIPSLRSGIPLS